MEFIELIKTPNVDGVRLLDASGRVDCQVTTTEGLNKNLL